MPPYIPFSARQLGKTSPCSPCHQAHGVLSHPKPSSLIKQDNVHPKRKRQEPVLDRDGSRNNNPLDRRRIEPQKRHGQRKQNGGKEVYILRSLVEQRRVLENAQAAAPRRHQIKPLHDDEVDKVNRRRLCQLLVVVFRRHVGRDLAEAEPQVLEGDAVALEVPVRHGKGRQRLCYADYGVGVEDELPVYQPVFLDVSRWAAQQVCFGLLIGQDGCSGAVSEAAANALAVRRPIYVHGTYQMMIMRNEERIWGRPKTTFVMTGQNSEKLPAGSKYAITCSVNN